MTAWVHAGRSCIARMRHTVYWKINAVSVQC